VRFFRPDNDLLPTVVCLDFVRPPGFEHLAHETWIEMLRTRISAVEDDVAIERAKTGSHVLGRKAVRKQSWRDRPRSQEPRRQLGPRVACTDKWRRIEALTRNRTFVDAYRSARALFVVGQSAPFPLGTYWLVKHAGVHCVPAPAPS
jgi:hypothetical protein